MGPTRPLIVALLCAWPAAGQDADRDAGNARMRAEREVVATETAQDRLETTRLILYSDKGVLDTSGIRTFLDQLDRGFIATSDLLGRAFDSRRFKVAKPTYYLTDRAGISHVNGPRVFLRAARVVKGPSIAVHETVHLLLGTDPAAPGIWLKRHQKSKRYRSLAVGRVRQPYRDRAGPGPWLPARPSVSEG